MSEKEYPEYSQGICGDGAAILKDGAGLTVDEIVWQLNHYANVICKQTKSIEAKDKEIEKIEEQLAEFATLMASKHNAQDKEIERLKSEINDACQHLDDSWSDGDWLGVQRVLLRFDEVLK